MSYGPTQGSYYDRAVGGGVAADYHPASNSYYIRPSAPTMSTGSSAFSPLHYIDEPRQLAPTLSRGFDEVDKFLHGPTAQEADTYWAEQRHLRLEPPPYVPRLPAKDYLASSAQPPQPLITRLDRPPHVAQHHWATDRPDRDYGGPPTTAHSRVMARDSPPRVHKGVKRMQEDYSPYIDAPLRHPQSGAEHPSFERNDKRRKSSALKSIRHFLRKHLRLAPPAHRADGFDLTVDQMPPSPPKPHHAAARAKSPFSPSGRHRHISASSHNVVNGAATVVSIHHRPEHGQQALPDNSQSGGEKRPPLVRAQSFSSAKTLQQQQRKDWIADEIDAVVSRTPSASGSPVKYQQRTAATRAMPPLSRVIPVSSASATRNGDAGDAGDVRSRDSQRYRNIAVATPCQLGIANHGNTCYMNAILQCLACLDRFAELFVCQHFLTAPSSITSTLAITLQSLWFNAAADGPCLRLLRLIADANPHFQIFCQQDAQESLIWLLDRIHEEIRDSEKSAALGDGHYNRLSSDLTMQLNKSEEELASAALRRVSGLNNRSAIMDLFRAQFRSSMECSASGCGFYNLTFDPYMSVSLSVPQPARTKTPVSRSCTVTLVPFFNRRELIRYRVALRDDRMTSVRDVKSAVMDSIGTPPECAVACQFSPSGLCQFLAGDLQIGPTKSTTEATTASPVSNKYHSLSEFTLVEIPRLNDAQLQQSEEGGPELVVVIVTFVMGGIVDATGGPPLRHAPFVAVLDRRWPYERIYRHVMDKGAFAFSKRYYPLASDFRLLLQHSSEGVIQIDPTLVMPLHGELVTRIVGTGRSSGAAVTLRLIVEWTPAAGYEFLRTDSEPVLNDYSLAGDSKSLDEERNGHQPPTATNNITLLNLLQDYTKSEQLPDWKCPRCFKHSGKKELKFHSLPPILVFHLKRFELLTDGATKKVESRVQIPLDSLDMSPYICNPDSRHNTLSRIHAKNHPSPSDTQMASTIYDLVGVVHHFGERTNSGHYTATTRNPVDGRWRNFDDLKVSFVPTHDIRSSTNAYLLFYASRTENSYPGQLPAGWFPAAVPEPVIAMYQASSKSGMDESAVNSVGSSTFYTSSNNAGDGTMRRRRMEVAPSSSSSSKRPPAPAGYAFQQANASPTRSKSHQTLSSIGVAASSFRTAATQLAGTTPTDGYFYDTSGGGEPRQGAYARY